MTDRLTIRKPDDWHLHVRDNEMLAGRAAVDGAAFRAGHSHAQPGPAGAHDRGRIAYRERAMRVLPKGARSSR